MYNVLISRTEDASLSRPQRQAICNAKPNTKNLDLTKDTLSQLHPQRLVDPQSLPDTKIEHDLFGSARNGVGTHVTVQPVADSQYLIHAILPKVADSGTNSPFNLSPLTPFRVTQSPEDLTRFSGTELERDGALRLEARNRTT